ncbi:MAG: hypothetical protein K6F94_09535 [Bacteroidaceae bacterium]|nr:hypothetical protein [Bacteroidaceae bacterium]
MKSLTYLAIFLVVCLLLALSPVNGILVWDQYIIIPCTALLFTLLVWLVARFLSIGQRPLEIIVIALFLLLFSPNADIFFSRDEEALIELTSQCIIPFFLSQYIRIRSKDFRRVYAFMLLMGIFCSFTHDGLTLPLCAAFLLDAWQRRSEVIHRACWPMMAGWFIGTALLFIDMDNTSVSLSEIPSRTKQVLTLLWDAKIFIIALVMTAWLSTIHWGRQEMRHIWRRNRLIAHSLVFALCLVPFAPLGIENAVTGVCFFSMLWTMLLMRGLERQWQARKFRNVTFFTD